MICKKFYNTLIITALLLSLNTFLSTAEDEILNKNDSNKKIETNSTSTESTELVWHENKTEVFQLAKEQGKLIFLLSGQYTCARCNDTKMCLATDESIRPIVDEKYIMWFSNYSNSSTKAEAIMYTQHLTKNGAVFFPLVIIIDPKDPENYVSSYVATDRYDTNLQTAAFLKNILENASKLTPNEYINLTDSKVTLYNNSLHISNNTDKEIVSIYSITGQLIHYIQKDEPSITIDASSYPNGVLIIHSSKGWSAKVIKN